MSHAASSDYNRRVLAGLLWYDWRRHRLGIVLGLSSVALILLVAGIAEPYGTGLFLTLVTAMGFSCGLGFGHAEWVEGHEEYALSWPATRDQRFWVRLALGSTVFAAMYLIGWITCYSPLPAKLAELLSIDTSGLSQEGLTPFDPGRELLIFAHVAPWLLFVETFVLSLALERRDDLGWLVELGLVVAAALGLQWAAQALLGAAAPWVVIPLLVVAGVMLVQRGLRKYRSKEAVLDAGATTPDSSQLRMIAVILLGLAVLGTVAFWIASAAANS